jgi:DNA repair photolyase
MSAAKNKPRKGRGAVSNPDIRYHAQSRQRVDDGWYQDDELPFLKTTLHRDNSKSILSHNQSPDVPFDVSINPYRGCEHGCVYCFARPTHAYLDFSPGLDFETQLIIKPQAPVLLRKALAKKHYQCRVIALGSNTDPYQPIEREQQITRQVLQVLQEARHPVAIVTKSALIERDIDILAEMAQHNLVQVMLSVCTLDKQMARTLEPRATTPARRLQTITRLTQAGIPVGVLVAPIIPVLNDPEIETIVVQSADAGATQAGYVLLRLPLEVAPLFEEWLQAHYPLKYQHVMTRIRDTRSGAVYQTQFGTRMRGEGAFADIIHRRFAAACQRFGIHGRTIMLATHHFVAPIDSGDQLKLF